MGLGYEVAEDNREFESQKVQRYATTSFETPCLIVHITEEQPVQKFTLDILRKMFVNSDKYEEDSASPINIYFSQGEKTVRFGLIKPNQVKTFLSLFKDNEITGFYSQDKELTGDYLYVLSE